MKEKEACLLEGPVYLLDKILYISIFLLGPILRRSQNTD